MPKMIKLHVLASGSKGNATLVENTTTNKSILIDCGICKRDFFTYSENAGVDLQNLEAILITHEHTDHTKGLGVVTRGLAKQGINPRVCVSREVYRSSKALIELRDACAFEAMQEEDMITAAGLNIHPFATSHDSSESYGFRIEADGSAELGYITDNGITNERMIEYLGDCRILALESNHDEKMLANGDYPYAIKKRIASDRGHLSNVQSAEVLETLLHNNLEHVIAMHISENNNTYRLPKETLEAVVDQNRHLAKVCVAYQHMAVTLP